MHLCIIRLCDMSGQIVNLLAGIAMDWMLRCFCRTNLIKNIAVILYLNICNYFLIVPSPSLLLIIEKASSQWILSEFISASIKQWLANREWNLRTLQSLPASSMAFTLMSRPT